MIEAQPVFIVGQSVPLLVTGDLGAASIGLGLAEIKQAFGLNPVTAPVAAPVSPELVTTTPVQIGSGIQTKANQEFANAAARNDDAIQVIRQYSSLLNQVASNPRSIAVTSVNPIQDAIELWEGVNRGTVTGALM